MVVQVLVAAVAVFFLCYEGLSQPLGTSLLFAGAVCAGAAPVLVKLDGRKAPRHFVFPDWSRAARRALRVLPVLLALGALKLGWAARYVVPGDRLLADLEREDVLKRRAYLISAVTAPGFGPRSMPLILPATYRQEWGIGTLSMASLALTNIAHSHPETCEGALTAVRHAIQRVLAPDFREYEVAWWGEDALDTLDGPRGHAGYLGHLNLMLAAYRFLGGQEEFGDLHRRVTAALARRLLESPSMFLETFPGQVFIPDNSVVAASVALHDRLHGPENQELLERWRTRMRSAVDPSYGVLRPMVDRSGTPSGIPRGSYAAWNNIYLYHVDRPLAREQYEGLRRHFLVRLPFGACAVREYPHGVRAAGDVDSGPVLFGLSTSGTGFAVASARYFEDAAVLDGLLRTAEAVGSSFDSARGRRYLAAPLVGDAIMLAMKTAREWDGRFVAHPRPEDSHLNGHVGGLPD